MDMQEMEDFMNSEDVQKVMKGLANDLLMYNAQYYRVSDDGFTWYPCETLKVDEDGVIDMNGSPSITIPKKSAQKFFHPMKNQPLNF